MFTAMSLGILQTREKRFLFSNAGLPYPIMKRGEDIRQLEVGGLPLGIVGSEECEDLAEYTDLSVDLEVGDFVVLYSDGVSEATDKAEKMYETERLLEVVQRADSSLSAQGMIDWILQDVTAFLGNAEPSDDITVFVLRCRI
jgi:serine phosphatase RsbU (regulator of sigma subunit)